MLDGVQFQNLEKVVECQQVQSIKKAYDNEDKLKFNKLFKNIKIKQPQLFEFLKKYLSEFEKYVSLYNDVFKVTENTNNSA